MRNQYNVKRMTLHCAGRTAFLSTQEIVNLTGLARRTAQTYVKDPGCIPNHVRELLEIKALGVIPGFNEAYIADGTIYLANGMRFTVDQLVAVTYTMQLNSELERELKLCRSKIEDLETYIDSWRQVASAPQAANDDTGVLAP